MSTLSNRANVVLTPKLEIENTFEVIPVSPDAGTRFVSDKLSTEDARRARIGHVQFCRRVVRLYNRNRFPETAGRVRSKDLRAVAGGSVARLLENSNRSVGSRAGQVLLIVVASGTSNQGHRLQRGNNL